MSRTIHHPDRRPASSREDRRTEHKRYRSTTRQAIAADRVDDLVAPRRTVAWGWQ